MCDDELTLMMYVDGESEESRAGEIRAHLERCGRCRALCSALRLETKTLAEALRGEAVVDADVLVARPQAGDVLPVPSQVAVAVALVATAVAVMRFMGEAVSVPVAQVVPDWLNPLHDSGRLSLLFSAAAYLMDEGAAVSSSLAATAGLLACAVLALSGLALTRSTTTARLGRVRGGIVGLVGLGVFAAAPVEALEIRRGSEVTVPAGQKVDDTLIAMGEAVQIDGEVTGDVIAMARRIRVRGTVRGNLLAFARDVEVDGTIEGSVLEAGQTVTTRGQANRDLYAFGQTVTLASTGRVAGNATTFSEAATIEGAIGRDLTSFGQRVDVAGTVGRGVHAYGQQVDVRAGARIEGGLTAHVSNRERVRVDSGATVAGTTDVAVRPPRPSRYATVSYYVRQVVRLAAAVVTGWLFFWCVPALTKVDLNSGRAVLTAAGVGFVAVVATPGLAIVAGVTLVGLPLAFATVAVWVAALYVAKIAMALFLGRALLKSDAESGRRLAAALLVGLSVIFVIINLPYVGGLLNALLTITGVGVLAVGVVTWFRGTRTAPSVA